MFFDYRGASGKKRLYSIPELFVLEHRDVLLGLPNPYAIGDSVGWGLVVGIGFISGAVINMASRDGLIMSLSFTIGCRPLTLRWIYFSMNCIANAIQRAFG